MSVRNFLKHEWRNCFLGIYLGFTATGAVLVAYHTLAAQSQERHERSRPRVDVRDVNHDGLTDLVLRYGDGRQEILLREQEGRLLDARLVGYCIERRE